MAACTASGKRREPQPCAESRSALAGSAVWGAENYTYTEHAQGLVAWLNEKIAKSIFPVVHVTLPTGNVSRGTANLVGLPAGLNLVFQGQGMNGATATTLNLQQNNLDIGDMLGDTGRIEFRNMGITNVRGFASAQPQLLAQSLRFVQGSSPTVRVHHPMPADAGRYLAVFAAFILGWSDGLLRPRERGSLAECGGHCASLRRRGAFDGPLRAAQPSRPWRA
jgi:hypothetical protein